MYSAPFIKLPIGRWFIYNDLWHRKVSTKTARPINSTLTVWVKEYYPVQTCAGVHPAGSKNRKVKARIRNRIGASRSVLYQQW